MLLFLAPPLSANGQEERAPNELEQRIAGCYELELGEWVERPATRIPSYTVPSRVELTLEPATMPRSWRLAPLIPALRGLAPSWGMAAADSLDLVWSTGFVGLAIKLSQPRDGEATGFAETFSDVILVETDDDGSFRPLPPSQAPARLARIECW